MMPKQELIQIMPKHGSHIWHVFMNRLCENDHDHTLYEFKNMMEWLSYGHEKIAQAFENRLPSTHRQCSRTEPEEIPSSTLMCAIGKNVTECEILKQLRATIDEHKAMPRGFYADFTDEGMYRLMSFTCAWHILKTATKMQDGWGGVDTSEGYMQDTSDRMFWERVYRSMGASDGVDIKE